MTIAGRKPGSQGEIASLLARHGKGILTRACPIDLRQLMPVGHPDDEATRARAIAIAEATLDEFLIGDGVYWRDREMEYWIVSPNLTGDALVLKLSAIRRAIGDRLREKLAPRLTKAPSKRTICVTGEQFAQILQQFPSAHLFELDLHEVVFGAAGPDLALTKRAWNVIEAVLAEYLGTAGYYQRQSPSQVRVLIPNLAKTLAELKRKVIVQDIRYRLGLSETPPEPGQEFKLGPLRRRRTTGMAVSGEDRRLWSEALARMTSAPAFDAAALLEEAKDATYSFAPVRRVKLGMTTGNVIRLSGVGPEPQGGQSEAATTDWRWDFLTLSKAIEELRRLTKQKQATVMIVPMHYLILDRWAMRDVFLQLCSQMPPPERNLIVFEILQLPRELDAPQIEERIRPLRPYCRSVAIRAELSRSEFHQLDRLNPRLVGVDLDQYNCGEEALCKALQRFATLTAAAGVQSYAHGIHTRVLADAATSFGFDYLSGDAIGAGAASAQGIVPLSQS